MRSWARAAICSTAVAALIAALWAGFAPASGAPGVVAQDGTWAGVWEDTSYTWQGKPSEFNLTQTGSSVSGTYDFCNGRINGTVSGNVLRGTWTQDAPPCGGASEGSGIFEYTLAGDGKSFTGRWQYKSKCSAAATCTEWRSPWNARKISGGCARPAARGAGGRAAAMNEVRVVRVVPGVEVHKADTPPGSWCPVTKDMVIKQGDEISCDPDGEVELAFADNSTVVVRNTTQLKIASFFTEGGVVRTEILLKMGEVAAKIHKSEATKSDMRIKNPSLITGVRGTTFRVFYDPGSKTALTSVTEGVVTADPTKSGLKTVEVRAGKEVEVGPNSMSKVVGIGKAGARKGNNRREALDRVNTVIAKGDDPCGSMTPRKGATTIKPDPNGWAVSVKLVGERKGTSKWRVARSKVTPLNRLARQVKKRCR